MKDESVKVAVRVRPMNQIEKDKNSTICIECDQSQNQISISKSEEDSKSFVFDYIYDWNSKQKDVYDQVAFPIVESVLQGYNGTIFAYGQTGCGKTHTMMGLLNKKEEFGIIPNSFTHLINYIKINSEAKIYLRCSFIEIYNEEVKDLLCDKDKKVDIREDPKTGVFLKDLSTFEVSDYSGLENLMILGNKHRHVGETSMNSQSSRSHSIFTVYAEIIGTDQGKIKTGKLNLVDLAGSERQSKTHTTGKALDEAKKINLSLTALSNVINALSSQKNHIPYRDSKLTRILQDSLGGNTKTVMIAAISPSSFNYEETISTLRYASRANSIKNAPKINEDPKDAKIRQYEQEIQNLKKMLDKFSNGSLPQSNVNISFENDDEKKILYEKIHYLENLTTSQPSKTNNISNEESKKFQEYREKNTKVVEKLNQLQQENKNNYEDTSKKKVKISKKVRELQEEIRIIEDNHYWETKDLMNTITELTKETKLYLGMLRIMLKDYEIRHIHELSEYDEESEEWRIVPFSIKDKNFKVLPNIFAHQKKEWIKEEKNSRDLFINDELIEGNMFKKKKNPIKQIFNNYEGEVKPNVDMNNEYFFEEMKKMKELEKIKISKSSCLDNLPLEKNLAVQNSLNYLPIQVKPKIKINPATIKQTKLSEKNVSINTNTLNFSNVNIKNENGKNSTVYSKQSIKSSPLIINPSNSKVFKGKEEKDTIIEEKCEANFDKRSNNSSNYGEFDNI